MTHISIKGLDNFIVFIFVYMYIVGEHGSGIIGAMHKAAQKYCTQDLKTCKISKLCYFTDPVQCQVHLLLLVNNRSVLLIGAPKDRPVSMDLLLLQSHHSTSDLHPPTFSCQLPRIPTGPESEKRDHLYPEDEGLYERVGVWRAPPPAPLLNSAQNQAITENRRGGGEVENRGLNEAEQVEVTAEYASVRKVRKLERGRRQEGSEEENTSESFNSTVHRKTLDPFHIPNFPKVNTHIQSARSQIVTK